MRSTRFVVAVLALAGGLAAAWPAFAGTSTLKTFTITLKRARPTVEQEMS